MTRGREAARKTRLRRARLPGYHPPRHAAEPRRRGTPMTLISRRQTLFLGGAAALPLTGLGEAFGQGAGDPVRKIILYSDTQGAVPQSFQAAQLIAQAWRQLGLDV